MPALAMVSVLLGCSGEDEPADAEPDETAASTSTNVDGEPATWSLPDDERPSSTTTSFEANVQRLACNSGVTGTVLEPAIVYGDSQVVLTFEVEPANNGGNANCQGNREEPFEVMLTEPLGDRDLVDGACLPGAEAETTSFCRKRGVRWQGNVAAALAARWACGWRGRSVFMYDRSSPPPGVSLEDVRRQMGSEAAGYSAVITRRAGRGATVRVLNEAGLVVRELRVTRWPNQSWAVDGGEACRGFL